MSERAFDIIIGKHSIECALKNKQRSPIMLYVTEDGLKELSRDIDRRQLKIQMCSTHLFQETAKKKFQTLDYEFSRVPSGLMLECTSLPFASIEKLYDDCITKDSIKVLALDQITDVHNGAAILRTAAFYGVDYILYGTKNQTGFSPTFFRIASGAIEYLNIVAVSNMTRTITKLQESGIHVVALSEHAQGEITNLNDVQKKCLILGAEDKGISNAVLRVIKNHMSLKALGEIKSLNVSVAGAVAMERCFS